MNHLKEIKKESSVLLKRFFAANIKEATLLTMESENIYLFYANVPKHIMEKTLENIKILELEEEVISQFENYRRYDLFNTQIMFELMRSDINGIKHHLWRTIDLDYRFRDAIDELVLIDQDIQKELIMLCRQVFHFFRIYNAHIRNPSDYGVFEFFVDNIFNEKAIENNSIFIEDYFRID